MTPISDFVNFGKELVIGTYLYPYTIFSDDYPQDPFEGAEIISEINYDDEKVYITRFGGLFSCPPQELKSIEIGITPRLEFQDKFISIANKIICELSLAGLVTEPVTSVHVSRAQLRDNHAWLTSGGGKYLYRTIEPFLKIYQQGPWITSSQVDVTKLEVIQNLEASLKLAQVSENIPLLIANAFSLFSKQVTSEALIDSWIVVEQIIDYLWNEYLDLIDNSKRKERLKDTRIYSSSVRIEVLYLNKIITEEEYVTFHVARSHRNDMIHRAKITCEWATNGMNAMQLAIEHILNKKIVQPVFGRTVSW